MDKKKPSSPSLQIRANSEPESLKKFSCVQHKWPSKLAWELLYRLEASWQ